MVTRITLPVLDLDGFVPGMAVDVHGESRGLRPTFPSAGSPSIGIEAPRIGSRARNVKGPDAQVLTRMV